jgi:hypothetical protein
MAETMPYMHTLAVIDPIRTMDLIKLSMAFPLLLFALHRR